MINKPILVLIPDSHVDNQSRKDGSRRLAEEKSTLFMPYKPLVKPKLVRHKFYMIIMIQEVIEKTKTTLEKHESRMRRETAMIVIPKS